MWSLQASPSFRRQQQQKQSTPHFLSQRHRLSFVPVFTRITFMNCMLWCNSMGSILLWMNIKSPTKPVTQALHKKMCAVCECSGCHKVKVEKKQQPDPIQFWQIFLCASLNSFQCCCYCYVTPWKSRSDSHFTTL